MRCGCWAWMIGLGLVLALAPAAWADEPEPGVGEIEAPPLEVLPEVVVRPPQVHALPTEMQPEITEAALRRPEESFDVPRVVTVETGEYLRRRRMIRSVPDALLRLPGVMVQKTAPVQSSPYIRGFTAYRNLLLIDGFRLNHSAMRAGPNQYWSTVDSYTIERLELVRGPMSVLYGSDAVGGTVNVVPQRRKCLECGYRWNGLFSTRAASGERAFFQRVQAEGNRNGLGWLGGVTGKYYGDIESGGGRLPQTGGIQELDGDLRFDWQMNRDWKLVFAGQHVGISDAPRTHTTVDAVPFRGTTVGSELQRDYDQDRDLVYARLEYDPRSGPFESASLGVSWHRHYEERDRLRTNGRRDLSGFELHQFGMRFQAQNRTPIGMLTWGGDWYHDEADTWRRNYENGVLDSVAIQGPFGDDSRYDLAGLFVQDELSFGRLDLVLGVRFTYAAAEADRVEDPISGNEISVDGDWSNLVGSVNALYHLDSCWNLFAGVGQAFRAPTLYDLTSFDVTGFVDTPAPGLDAEKFVTFETGVKARKKNFAGYASVWYTLLQDTLVRSLTGDVFEGTPVVRADNIGDGWMWGCEVEAAYRFRPTWVAYTNASYLDGEADEFNPDTGVVVRSPVSRMMPLNATLGLRYAHPCDRLWAAFEGTWMGKEDRLSLRDQTDTSRIPPGGTPSWASLSLRGGYQIDRNIYLGLALENLLDENYRIHGSGQNEPGLNLIATLEARF